MKIESKKLDLHFFVCTNQRDSGLDCRSKGGLLIRDELKKWARDQGYAKLRINASQCLGHCDEGVVAVAYPQNCWKVGLSEASIPELKTEITKWMTK